MRGASAVGLPWLSHSVAVVVTPTQEIILVHHTDCGMLTFQDHEVKDQIASDTGARPHFALEAFPDVEDDIRQSIVRLKANPFIDNKDQIRGFVFDVKTGGLKEITI